MFAIIVGGGRTGSYLAANLVAAGHEVTILETREDLAQRAIKEVPEARVINGDGADPEVLERAGTGRADLVAVVTGVDENNLVICQLAKYTYGVAKVIARVNNPKNEWLFTKDWGVDVAVSAIHIISSIIQEDATLGDIVTLLKLRHGELSLLEVSVSDSSKAADKSVRELSLPSDAVMAAILRGSEIVVPRGETKILAGDQILIITTCGCEKALQEQLS